jgi:hypothetical protein
MMEVYVLFDVVDSVLHIIFGAIIHGDISPLVSIVQKVASVTGNWYNSTSACMNMYSDSYPANVYDLSNIRPNVMAYLLSQVKLSKLFV